MTSETGKIIVFIGLAVTAVGLVIYFFHDKLGFFGHLPGDIAVEKENFKFYFPVTTLILINVLVWLAVKIWNSFRS